MRLTRALPLLASFAFLLTTLASTASAGDPPRALRYMVKGTRHRVVHEIAIGDQKWEGYKPFSDLPFLIWPADFDAPAPVRRDRDAVARWITSLSGTLGHADFTPVFQEEGEWIGTVTWRYRLERGGIELADSSVQVFWEGDVLVGLVNDVPGRFVKIPEAQPGDDVVYFPREVGRGRFALDLLQQVTTTVGGKTVTTFSGPSAPNLQMINLPLSSLQGISKGDFDEWPLPGGMGSFPDQIDSDSKGRIWFSQPLDNQLNFFHPGHQTFNPTAVTAGDGPDGLMVSSSDEVWSGLFFSGDLGRYDPVAGVHYATPAPYPNAALAIPTETSHGTIIVTDHSGKVLEWDPQTQQWIKNVSTPSANPHIVAGVEGAGDLIWFTEFNTNRLASLDLNTGIMQEIVVPGGGGPAFPAFSNGLVFFSLWNTARMGAYDPGTGMFTFWNYTPTNEYGGPIFTAPNGDVVLGTRGSGYIFVHRAQTGSLTGYKIPTSSPGLKDGLTVSPDGAVWFTETGANKLARLKYPH